MEVTGIVITWTVVTLLRDEPQFTVTFKTDDADPVTIPSQSTEVIPPGADNEETVTTILQTPCQNTGLYTLHIQGTYTRSFV